MNHLNLALYSEYVVNHLDCVLAELPLFTVLQTPTTPNYYFGNLIALKVPLRSQSKQQWQQDFHDAFKTIPKVKHQTYTWQRTDSHEADEERIAEFVEAGFKYDETHILSLAKSDFVNPNSLNNTVVIRELTHEKDWAQWLELSFNDLQSEHDDSSLRSFLESRKHNYRRLAEKGYGQYLGAFDGDRLVGYAGLYSLNDIARFQNVLVIEDYQNRGIAKTLLTTLINVSSNEVDTLVIHADEHYHATKLYQSLGFEITLRECSLCWWPDKPH